jgi:hypothetical protein
MRKTIIKGWDKRCITKAFLPTFQLVAIVANAATPLFKEPKNVEVVEGINFDIDPIMPMSTIVENCL